MRTQFGKRLVATGLIAALGIGFVPTGAAFAGPGRDGRDRNADRSWSSDRDRGGWNRGNRDHGKSFRNGGKDGDRGDDRGRTARKRGGDDRHDRRDRNNRHDRARHTLSHGAPVRWKAPAHAGRKRPVVYAKPGGRQAYWNHPAPVRYGPPPRVVVVPERRHYRNVRVVRHYGHRYHGYGHYHHDRDAYKWLAFTAITVALINNLSEYQQRAYEDAQIRATTAPIGETIHWQDSGAYGTVTATREGTSSFNRYCREFQKTVTIGGRTEQAYGTACMQPDGAWEVMPPS